MRVQEWQDFIINDVIDKRGVYIDLIQYSEVIVYVKQKPTVARILHSYGFLELPKLEEILLKSRERCSLSRYVDDATLTRFLLRGYTAYSHILNCFDINKLIGELEERGYDVSLSPRLAKFLNP